MAHTHPVSSLCPPRLEDMHSRGPFGLTRQPEPCRALLATPHPSPNVETADSSQEEEEPSGKCPPPTAKESTMIATKYGIPGHLWPPPQQQQSGGGGEAAGPLFRGRENHSTKNWQMAQPPTGRGPRLLLCQMRKVKGSPPNPGYAP